MQRSTTGRAGVDKGDLTPGVLKGDPAPGVLKGDPTPKTVGSASARMFKEFWARHKERNGSTFRKQQNVLLKVSP